MMGLAFSTLLIPIHVVAKPMHGNLLYRDDGLGGTEYIIQKDTAKCEDCKEDEASFGPRVRLNINISIK